MITLILFDASDVLYTRKVSIKGYAKSLLQEAGFTRQPSPEEWQHLRAVAHSATVGKSEYTEYWETFFRLHGVPPGPTYRVLLEKVLAQNNAVYPREGIPSALEALRRAGYTQGVITDTMYPTEWKRNWLDTVGALPYLDVFVCSREVGVAKPDPSIYRIALKEGKASPEQTLFVGHATHELEGAKALGIRTVAVFKDEGARGDYEIRSLTELPPLLVNLQ